MRALACLRTDGLIEYAYTHLIIHYGVFYSPRIHTPKSVDCSTNAVPPQNHRLILTNIHTLGNQVPPGLQYLSLQLLVRIWNIVECEDSPTELEKEVCAEGDEGPEGDLSLVRHNVFA
jgi:hypothetical protein